MHLEAVIERVWRYNWRPCSSEFGDRPGGRDRASWEMHLQAVIEQVWTYTLGGCNRASLEIQLEAVIERDWTCTWRPLSSEIGGVLGGGESGGSSLGGRRDGSCDSMNWLTHNCGNVVNRVQHGLPRDERLAGSGRQSILG